jgi:U4/U6 small nuclear ribonucleoprotein PRP31
MSTVADDLLNDFGSSGDEAEDGETNDGLVHQDQANGDHDAMDVDGGANGADGRRDESPSDGGDHGVDDAETTKAKVEKMELGAVKDVRSVASLMQTLEPILQVSFLPFPSP